MNRTRLDDALRDWAARKTADERTAAALGHRVRRQVARDGTPLAAVMDEGPGARVWPRRAFWMLAGAAAAALFMAVIGQPAARRNGLGGEAEPRAADGSSLRRTTVLFREAATLFPHGLRWVSETAGDVHIEVNPDPSPLSPAMDRVVAIRLTVMVRHGNGPWQEDWAASVVTTGEDRIGLHLPDRGTLVLWALRVDDACAMTETEIDLRRPVVAATVGRIVRFGTTEEILRLQTLGREYRVLQTVTTLGGGTDGCRT